MYTILACVSKHDRHPRSHSVEHCIHHDVTLNMHLTWPVILHCCRKSGFCDSQVHHWGEDTSRRLNELLNYKQPSLFLPSPSALFFIYACSFGSSVVSETKRGEKAHSFAISPGQILILAFQPSYFGVEPLSHPKIKNCVFWDDLSCGSCKSRRFGGT
jgi:hypothetical protein